MQHRKRRNVNVVVTKWLAATLAIASSVLAALSCGARSELDRDGGIRSACAGFGAEVGLANLDVFMMIDASGSMESFTAQGVSKWSALSAAIDTFVSDTTSLGTRLGVGFFPQVDEAVPRYCMDENQCGGATCLSFGLCFPTGAGVCQMSSQCPVSGDECQPLGLCEDSEDQFCDLSLDNCAQGACVPAGYCENRTRCAASEYVIDELVPLPDQAQTIRTALDAHEQDGFTPTLPALQGTIDAAAAWAETNPMSRVVVVLATDGLPTVCDPALQGSGIPAAVDNVVAVAAEGRRRGVDTFVIGVFTPEEQAFAQESLDAIAEAGGTERSFTIATNDDVAVLLLEALTEVRSTGRCDYAMPISASADIDYSRIRVRVPTQTGGEIWADFRASEAECGEVEAGFFYDAPLQNGVPPSRIILCPTTCAVASRTIFVACPP